MSKFLKYGCVSGIDTPSTQIRMASGQAMVNQSGHFVIMSQGYAKLCAASTTLVFAFVEDAAGTPSSGDYRKGILATTGAKYRVPVNSGTIDASYIGKAYDLTIVSSVQGIDLTVTSRKHVIVVEVDTTNNTAIVAVNPAIIQTAEGTV